LCFALELEEQKRGGFHYQYSNYQIEYSRNLIFSSGREMDEVFQPLIDRSRVLLDIQKVKTILGFPPSSQISLAKKQLSPMGSSARETCV
jgi:hypothetical protein